jgi:hypothetical protein
VRAFGTLVAMALMAAVLAGPAGAKQAAKCRTTETVLAQNRFIRVWERNTGNGEDFKLTACRRSDGRRMTMLKTRHPLFIGSSTRFDHLTLNRHFAAFEVEFSGGPECEGPPGFCKRIKVRSYDTRKERRRLEAGNGQVDVDALVVTAKGAVAWAEPAGGGEAIQASDAAGTMTLDSGAIDPSSLGVELTIVSWTRDGEEHFARLR